MKIFQKPLNPEEESYYLEKFSEGDIEAKNTLIERNMRLVAHIAKKYQGVESDAQDLISIGTIGLIKAVSTFKQSTGNRLATYAARCIENELLMFLRGKKKSSKEISLYEPIGTDKEGNEINLLDIIEHTECGIVEQISLKDDIIKLYEIVENQLLDREKEVIKMRYGLYQQKEMTQREIGVSLDISRSYSSVIIGIKLVKPLGGRTCFIPIFIPYPIYPIPKIRYP